MYGAVSTFQVSVSCDTLRLFQEGILLTVVSKNTTNQTYKDRQSLCWPIASVVKLRPDLGGGGFLRAQLLVVSAIQAA